MTPVVGYLKLLVSEELGPLSPIQRKALVAVDAATSRLRALVDTLLDVSSLETGRLHFYARDYDFARVAKRALEESRARFNDRQITLRERRVSIPMPAVGDPDKLRRAIAHLLDNAAKFTPLGAEVAVSVGFSEDGHSYEVVVADSGPGVPAEHLEKVLEPFYQVDGTVTRVHGGVGLGLAFVRRVAEAMGGHVTVRSPPTCAEFQSATGTEVTLTIRPRPVPVGGPRETA
jgi:signal transduction histidine kinase